MGVIDIAKSMTAYGRSTGNVNGKNISFKCSDTLSFTGVNNPTIKLLSKKSYAKWSRNPAIKHITYPILIIFLYVKLNKIITCYILCITSDFIISFLYIFYIVLIISDI